MKDKLKNILFSKPVCFIFIVFCVLILFSFNKSYATESTSTTETTTSTTTTSPTSLVVSDSDFLDCFDIALKDFNDNGYKLTHYLSFIEMNLDNTFTIELFWTDFDKFNYYITSGGYFAIERPLSRGVYKFSLVDGSFSLYSSNIKTSTSSTGSTSLNTASDLLYYDLDVYDEDGVLFLKKNQPVQLKVLPEVEGLNLGQVMKEILGVLPVILIILVGLIGLRKALAMLFRILRKS